MTLWGVHEWSAEHVERLRTASRLTKTEFARRLGVTMRSVTNWENGARISPFSQSLLDAFLIGAKEDVTSRFQVLTAENGASQSGNGETSSSEAESSDTQRKPPEDSRVDGQHPDRAACTLGISNAAGSYRSPVIKLAQETPPTPTRVAGSVVESPTVVLERIKIQGGFHLSDATLDALDSFINDVIDRYELEGPSTLAGEVVSQRRWLQPSLTGWVPPRHAHRLATIAGKLSGWLSYMAVNLGLFSSARAYGSEAFQLAEHAENDDLKAWVRGTQSLAEFYDGQYRKALDYAVDGRRYADSGPQAVRLAVNGQARALGHLEERKAAEATIDEAYELLPRFPSEPGMSPCISFGVYSRARVASNAATAYLALPLPDKALQHAQDAAATVETSSSQWSHALVRLDMASAFITKPRPELEHGIALATEAMTASRENRIESIRQRLRTFQDQLAGVAEPAMTRTFDEQFAAWLTEESVTT
ncbi:helix-turn-helix domain-containing protein [Polymorphospora sp. NPDC051019]|uniref:helix-turn-helix domain-containing protein n=1 Tax=Polymorphospora sp. NPDC051019 TaxID=3155725 RepID=UPI00344777A3